MSKKVQPKKHSSARPVTANSRRFKRWVGTGLATRVSLGQALGGHMRKHTEGFSFSSIN